MPPTPGLEHPDWSPDGRWITFNIAPEAPNAGSWPSPNGKDLQVIRRSDDRFELFKPVWSPDGRKLLVGCFDVQAQSDRLCVMDANGRNLHVVLATPTSQLPGLGHPPTQALTRPGSGAVGLRNLSPRRGGVTHAYSRILRP